MLFLQGCASEFFSTRLESAENKLTQGKPANEDLKKDSIPLLPPSVAARYKIALAMDSYVKGEASPGAIAQEFKKIKDDSFTPSNQKIEAGYLLLLMERIETLQKSLNIQSSKGREYAKEGDELKKAYDQLKKENDDARKELELLTFKLKKLEEIHIQTEKRRGSK
ncbi:hypothetical protein EG832_17770 [bacterium]|nr:hypothetical protein [bacterium]